MDVDKSAEQSIKIEEVKSIPMDTFNKMSFVHVVRERIISQLVEIGCKVYVWWHQWRVACLVRF